MEPSTLTNILYKKLNFLGERQKVISGNIANINTPDYKTKDISFEDELKKATKDNDLKLKVTHSSHIATHMKRVDNYNIKTYEVDGLQEQNDGNNVNLDDQMSHMAKNSIMFDAVQQSIKKDAAWMKEIIMASSKN
jgi:flagellar basal-body rod protein FlgB